MAIRALNTVPAASPIARALLNLSREQIETLIEEAIGLLDAANDDCDLEDVDPAGGAIDDAGEGDELYRMLPHYDVDQTAGPVNEAQAHREYALSLLPPDVQALQWRRAH